MNVQDIQGETKLIFYVQKERPFFLTCDYISHCRNNLIILKLPFFTFALIFKDPDMAWAKMTKPIGISSPEFSKESISAEKKLKSKSTSKNVRRSRLRRIIFRRPTRRMLASMFRRKSFWRKVGAKIRSTA